jgi:hypothetical protein
MDPLESRLAIDYSRFKRRERYDKRNADNLRKRLHRHELLSLGLQAARETEPNQGQPQTTSTEHNVMYTDIHDYHRYEDDQEIYTVPDEPQIHSEDNCRNDYEGYGENHGEGDDNESIQSDTDETEASQPDESEAKSPVKNRLHHYSNTTTYDYCATFTSLSRKANICKRHSNALLSFIKSGLPVPNNMPSTGKQLLSLLNVDELFTKQSICLPCARVLDYQERTCSQCHSTEKTALAYV